MPRLATSDGRFVGWTKLPHGMLALAQAVVRKSTGRVPRVPWIPFSACAALGRLLTSESVVWEVGAGYSTLWLADRVRHVTSIEASREWFEKLSGILKAEGVSNVDLRYEWEVDRMADFSSLEDRSLDLLFIDGGPRGRCLERGFSKVKSGGHIYLDNWDAKHFWESAVDFPLRNRHLLVAERSFVDYVPAQFGVYEGLLLTKA